MSSAKRNKIVAIAAGALAVLVLGGGYLTVVSPKRSKAADLKTQIETTQTRLTIALAQSHSPRGTADRVKVADLYRLSRAMPDRADVAGVLLDLSRAADQAGVKLQSVTPSAPGAAVNGYQSVPIAVEFQGRYEQLTTLLSRLRKLVSVRGGDLSAGGRLFGVDSVDFAAGEAGFPQVKATLALEAYVFAPSVPAPAATTVPDSSTTAEPAPTTDSSASAAGAGTDR